MLLHYTSIGKGPSLIILHGLYGQGNNWQSIAQIFSAKHTVYLIDQRNHGKSCHNPSHNYDEMALDLLELCNSLGLKSFDIIGHSMGGKTAITFALKYPGFINRLIIVDISPHSYLDQNNFAEQASFHKNVLDIFRNAPIKESSTRDDVDDYFAKHIENLFIRKFLLKNLKRTKKGDFYWQLNYDALSKNLEKIIDAAPPVKLGAQSSCPTLFIRGGKSPYISDEEMQAIPDVFKNAQFTTFENAGHWLHVEETDKFIDTVQEFLDK